MTNHLLRGGFFPNNQSELPQMQLHSISCAHQREEIGNYQTSSRDQDYVPVSPQRHLVKFLIDTATQVSIISSLDFQINNVKPL